MHPPSPLSHHIPPTPPPVSFLGMPGFFIRGCNGRYLDLADMFAFSLQPMEGRFSHPYPRCPHLLLLLLRRRSGNGGGGNGGGRGGGGAAGTRRCVCGAVHSRRGSPPGWGPVGCTCHTCCSGAGWMFVRTGAHPGFGGPVATLFVCPSPA